MSKYVISSGHSLKVRGASGILDEVNEARIVTNKVASYLKQLGSTVTIFHDDVSTTQTNNINTIVRYHNSKVRDIDISVHFNAASPTDSPRGVEVLYLTSDMGVLAAKVSKAIASVSGLKDRGAKKRENLGFLNGTHKPAILIEVCFVDSKEDARLYRANLDEICKSIAESLSGKKFQSEPIKAVEPVKVETKAEVKDEIKKETVRMYKPSNNTFLNETLTVLKRLEDKEVHGEKALAPIHREKLLKGELSLDDATAILYVALSRGLILGQKQVTN